MSDKHSYDSVPGANPDFGDVANQSDQEQVAFETWVNTALNMMERGATDTEVLAKLSHDGCPDPETVVQRAKMQPVEPVPNEEDLSGMSGREDIFQPMGTEEEMDESQAIQASVRDVPEGYTERRVEVSGMPGTEIGTFETYGEKLSKVALDNGQTIDVPTSEVKEAAEDDSLSQRIRGLLEGLPEIENLSHVARHRTVWAHVKAACRARGADDMDDTERARLADLEQVATASIEELDSALSAARFRHDQEQIIGEALPDYSRKHMYATEGRKPFNAEKFIHEGAPIWVSELHDTTVTDAEVVAQSARAHVASTMEGMDPQRVASVSDRFVEAAEQWRARRVEELGNTPNPKTASEASPDVPDDALFM